MHWKATALFAAAFVLAGFSYLANAGDAKDAVKKDRKALQGAWKAAGDDNKAGIVSMRIEGDKFVVTFKGDKTVSGTYTIDPSKKPKTIDMKIVKASGNEVEKYEGKTALAVYEFDGAKLKWHSNEPGKEERPKGLTEETGVLIVFERAKK